MIFRKNYFFSKYIKLWIVFLIGLKLLCTLLAIFVFARYSPLVDANLYLSGAFTSENILRTRMIQGITSTLSIFGGEVFVHSSFGVFSLAGIFYYFLRERVHWQICLPLLLPSTLIWTSVIGKEAIFYGAYTLGLAIWTRFILRKCDLLDYILLILALT